MAWTTLIAPVIKDDRSIRIFVPVVNDILVTLKKGRTFAKFDLVQTYHQLLVDKLRLHNAQKSL
ncbi:hypothetical protein T02_13953 [Trichinella nativa]|uniref:Reverse transcriptase domain-containing protein n=1 Tax=Trichinella nativa TaxID=6335 RepID=A0A0V1KWI0_9BILA|nr:hypothetical protein T02_13953 [Trichinella nativa]